MTYEEIMKEMEKRHWCLSYKDFRYFIAKLNEIQDVHYLTISEDDYCYTVRFVLRSERGMGGTSYGPVHLITIHKNEQDWDKKMIDRKNYDSYGWICIKNHLNN